jgi:hypothetical protein
MVRGWGGELVRKREEEEERPGDGRGGEYEGRVWWNRKEETERPVNG